MANLVDASGENYRGPRRDGPERRSE
jgi:hypothetical protein